MRHLRFNHASAALLLLFASSCAPAPATGDPAIHAVAGIEQLGRFAEAAVRYRGQVGRWPTHVSDLAAASLPPDLRLGAFERLFTFRATERGLTLVSRESGEAMFTVGSESTPANVLVIRGDGGSG